MSDDKVKSEGLDVSGYMPPQPPYCPPQPPYSPEPPYSPKPTYCPPDGIVMDTLAHRLKAFKGQQVTVYIIGIGPLVGVQAATGGPPVVTPSPAGFGLTGTLENVGSDYIDLSIIINSNKRSVYIPIMAIGAVTPGGALSILPMVTVSTGEMTL